MSFDGKVVLITGAASGIGAATARQFAQLKASLALVDVNEKYLKEVGRECGDRVLLITADLANDADVTRVVEKTIQHYGRLDVLANVAGIFEPSTAYAASIEHFDTIFSVNARGLFNLTITCIPHLIETKGNIVSVSSATTHRIVPMGHVYGMSKAAIDYMTKSFAVELAHDGVRVNSVNPGPTDTNIGNPERLPELRKMAVDNALLNIPLGRLCDPSEVARVIIFLASDHASFITGVSLAVDGAFRHFAEFKL